MKKRSLVRIQLTLLVILAVLVVIRLAAGPPDPKGLVVFVNLEPYQLGYKAFELSQPARIAVSATGSFDPEAVPAALAAYGWIVRRADRVVVWTMEPGTVVPGRGTTARVQGDTLILEPGLYDVYYTTYGATFSGHSRRARWRNDAEAWQLVLRLVEDTPGARALPEYGLDDLTESSPYLLKALTRLGNDQQQSYLFTVRRPTRLGLYAVGEVEQQQYDYAWIENAENDTRIWEMTRQNTEPAGGLARNRLYRGDLTLDDGTYRAVAVTDDEHAFDTWEGNPPFDPVAWGLTLFATDADAIAAFDPWAPPRTPLVSLTRVPDDAERSRRFAVSQPIQVVLYSVGEMTDRRGIYDYGELLKEEAGQLHTVWKMSYEASGPAGGARKNRLEVAFLRLEPGTYVLRYQTDGSHAFDDWNADEPDYPDRWGVTLFPMASALPEGALRLLPDDPTGYAPDAPPPPPAAVAHAGHPLVDWTHLENDASEEKAFELKKETRLHIVSLGEITLSGRHDYGWIERAGTGEKAWEMSLDNTRAAGGADRNRRFDGIVTLPPGRYVARYTTDFSHHYGDFGDGSPAQADAWGMTIYRVAEDASAATVDN